MPKIRLLKVHSNWVQSRYDEDLFYETIDIQSPWQEVTDEELQLLKQWQGKKILDYNLLIIEEVIGKNVIDGYISDIKKYIEKEKKRRETESKKYEDISKKQKERSERLKLEKAKRLLEAKGLKVTK